MKKKIILIVIIIVIAIILARFFIFYDKYKMPKGAEITISNEDIDVYDETNLYDLIKSNNVEILSEDIPLDYMNIGEHIVTIEYKYKMKKYAYDIKYNVVDNVKPIFINVPSTKTLYVNEGN